MLEDRPGAARTIRGSDVRREHEDLLAVGEAHGVVWSPYFPLGGGGYAGLPRVTDHPELVAIAAELDATPNQIGLAWLLARSPLSLAIAGTSSISHLEENAGAAGVRLPDEALRRLDDAAPTSPADRCS